jgi:predicted MPP superfamily phosphohydrolase
MKEINVRTHFFYFSIFAQIVGLILHFFLFLSIINLFPFLASHKTETGLVLGILSVSFLFFNIIDHLIENPFVRAGYILSAIWLPVGLYFQIVAIFIFSIKYILRQDIPFLPEIIFSAVLLFIFYGLINARKIKIREIKVKLPNLPNFWKGKTAVLASDLHFGHVLRKPSAEKIVRIINSLDPEIVFIPGDFFDGAKSDFVGVAEIFKKISAKSGVFFTSGNHEIIAGLSHCLNAISKGNIELLENKKIEIQGLQILGTSYQSRETVESLKNILHILDIDKNKPSILLKHVPDHLEAVANAEISLTLSGHTHLGQMWPFNILTKKMFGNFDYGLNQLGKSLVYTSSGVGTWGPPVRIFTHAEIVKIVFE